MRSLFTLALSGFLMYSCGTKPTEQAVSTDSIKSAPPVMAHTTDRHTTLKWVDATGGTIPAQGKFELHFLFSDSTESNISHLGDTLDNGYPRCIPVNLSADRYKLIFTPSEPMDFTLAASIDLSTEFNDRSGPFTAEFKNAEADKMYSFVVQYPNVSYVSCGDATISVTTGKGAKGTGMLFASCGD